MPFVNFRKKRSHERSQRHFRANFWVGVASRCVELEVEPRIAKQYKCHHCCSCKNYRGKGMEGGKKSVFWADQKIASSWKKYIWGHPIAQATSYCLLPGKFWLRASKMSLIVFKVGSVKFANSLSPPSTVKKVCTGSKSSQGMQNDHRNDWQMSH